jgi:hypothetical protein
MVKDCKSIEFGWKNVQSELGNIRSTTDRINSNPFRIDLDLHFQSTKQNPTNDQILHNSDIETIPKTERNPNSLQIPSLICAPVRVANIFSAMTP